MNPAQTLKENAALLEQYANKEFEYAQLKLFYQLGSVSTSIAQKTIIGLFAVIALVFINIALAMWLGQALSNFALGFLLVGAGYLIIAFIAYLMRKRIETYIIQKMSAKYF